MSQLRPVAFIIKFEEVLPPIGHSAFLGRCDHQHRGAPRPNTCRAGLVRGGILTTILHSALARRFLQQGPARTPPLSKR
jgi:hypothetical protein